MYRLSAGVGPSADVYFDDPVWDGDACSDRNNACSDRNNCCSDPSLPWFYHQSPLTASEDTDTRICRDKHTLNEDIPVREVQLYIQQLYIY